MQFIYEYFGAMIRWIILVGLWSFFGSGACAQVSGLAFLAGQTDHSGVMVKFIPVAGAAELDSTHTSANGAFSIDVVGGVYQVVYSKAGYQSLAYHNGESLALPPGHVLDDVELTAGSTLFVSGNVSGIWSSEHIYIVTGDIVIPAGETLVVKEGTQVRFNGYYSILAEGRLTISGTSALPVTVTSNRPEPQQADWFKIELIGEGSTIDHAILEYCDWCVFFYDLSPKITNSTIRKCRSGIYGNSSEAIVRNNEVYDFGLGAASGWGIWFETGTQSLIECNHVHSGEGYGGIITKGNDVVRDNHIHDIGVSNEYYGFGIVVDNSGTSVIYNNLIYNCVVGIHNGCNTGEPTTPTIHNNVILNNKRAGILFAEYHTSGHIANNIIAGNQYGLRRSHGGPGPTAVTNNLFWNNTKDFENIAIPGLGVTVGQNANGDAIDSYGNLKQSPLFVTEVPPTYDPESPVFDAGDTTYYAHIGITAVRECLRVEEPEEPVPELDTLTSEVVVFPNPCVENCQFLINRPDATRFGLQLFNSMGQLVARRYFDSPSITMDRGDLADGVYFCELSDDLGWRSTHKLVLR
jgi:hypothetical protein